MLCLFIAYYALPEKPNQSSFYFVMKMAFTDSHFSDDMRGVPFSQSAAHGSSCTPDEHEYRLQNRVLTFCSIGCVTRPLTLLTEMGTA